MCHAVALAARGATIGTPYRAPQNGRQIIQWKASVEFAMRVQVA